MNIIHLVSNKVWGGGERYVLDLAIASRQRGHNVEVFTRNKPDVSDKFKHHNLHTGYLRLGGSWDIITPIRLASHLNSIKGEIIIHVHNLKDAYSAILAKKLYRGSEKIKIVCTRHLIKPAKTDAAHLHTINNIDALVFVSQCAKDTFLSSEPNITRNHLHVIHNSIMAPKAAKRTKTDTSKPVNLIFAGRIVPEKGLDVLIEALGLLKSIPWTLDICGVGEGNVVMPIVRASRALEIDKRITWHGFVDDIHSYFAKADIALAPSRWSEPFGLTILEAISQGLAIISTNQGGPTEIIENGVNGILVAPENPRELADAIQKLIENPEFRLTLSSAGVDTFNNKFDYDDFVDKIFRIYSEC